MSTIKWATATSGDWNTAANWTPVQVPGLTSVAAITPTGTYTVTSSQNNVVGGLQMQKSATLDITADALHVLAGTGNTLAGTITVENGAGLALGADAMLLAPRNGITASNFTNSGTITFEAGAGPTDFTVWGTVTLLSTLGQVVLSGVNDQIVSSGFSSELISYNTISGIGTIGGGTNLFFGNAPGGVVDADDLAGGELIINCNFANSGKMEATNTGVLLIESNGSNASNAIITAATAGAAVELDNATVAGGTFSTVAGAFLNSTGGFSEISVSKTIQNAGQIGAEGGNLMILGPVNNTGTLDANGNSLQFGGKVTGVGTATIENGGTIEFGIADTAIKQNVTFNATATTETLRFDATASTKPTLIYGGVITGFDTTNDVIDFTGLAFAGSTTASAVLSGANTVVTVTQGKNAVSFTLAGDHTGDTFTVAQDTLGGTMITDPPGTANAAHTNLLVQAIAGFNSGSGAAQSSQGHLSDHVTKPELLAVNSQHGS